jgi:hypothetical protein
MTKNTGRFVVVFLLAAFTGMLYAEAAQSGKPFENIKPAGAGGSPGPSIKAGLCSLMFPGIGQFQNKQAAKGAVFMGIGAILLGTTLYMGLSQSSLWNTYAGSRTSVDYDKYKTRVDTANFFIGITAAFWTFNVIEAYSGGSNHEKQAGSTADPAGQR